MLGLLASLGPAAGLGIVLRRLAARPTWCGRELRGLFVLAGVGTFAAATALGFLVYCGPEMPAAAHGLGMPVAVVGIALLFAGSSYTFVSPPSPRADDAAPLHLWRTAGTITALAGIAIQFAAFAIALPNPSERWLVGSVNVLSLAVAAWRLPLPLLHVPAQAYLILLVHTGFGAGAAWMLPTPALPLRLAALVAAQALAGELSARLGRRIDALHYAIGAGVSSALAAWWCGVLGAGHPAIAALTLGATGCTWLIANLRWRRPLVTYAALALLLGGTLPLARLVLPAPAIIDLGEWVALAHASFCTLLAAAVARPRDADRWVDVVYGGPARTAALVGTGLAVVLLPVAADHGPIECGIAAGWLALVWLVLASQNTAPLLFAAFQAALSVCAVAGTVAATQAGAWSPLRLHAVHAGAGAGSAQSVLGDAAAPAWRGRAGGGAVAAASRGGRSVRPRAARGRPIAAGGHGLLAGPRRGAVRKSTRMDRFS